VASGLCGFGLGATPNALVCMQTITMKHGPSEKAFFCGAYSGGISCGYNECRYNNFYRRTFKVIVCKGAFIASLLSLFV